MAIHKANADPPREKLFLLWNSIQRILPDLNAEDSKPTEDHESRIRRHYDQLLNNLNVPDVVTQMFKSGKLTAKEHEHLRQFYSTPIRASEELLNIIIVSSRDVYDCFIESLKKTKQHHVHQMVTSDEESLCIDELQSMFEHSRIIRQNYDWLTENLDPDSGLLTNLFATDVLSQREYCQVVFEKDRYVKNEILLSIIGRKSIDDFRKFKIALNDVSQLHITKRLTDTPVGDENQNVTTTTVERTFLITSSESLERRIPPKPPPKPKKQPHSVPSSKLMVIKPKPLLEANIHPSEPSRIDRRRNFTKHEVVKKKTVEYLEEKFRKLPNELQTEVSIKVFLMHQMKSADIIWKISSAKILEESRNVKRQHIKHAKAAEENSERLMQEIVQRERECKMIKENNQREKTRTNKQLREMQERLHELQGRLDLTEHENRNLYEKLRNKEVEVGTLKAGLLNMQQAKTANEKVIEKLESQVAFLQIKFKEKEASVRDTEDKLIEKDLELKGAISRLEEAQEMFKDKDTKKSEFEAKLKATEKGIDNLKAEDNAAFNLDQKLEDERKLWAEEKDELMKQMHKLQQESFADLRYNTDPVLVQTIRSKAKDDGKRSVFGMTILDKELFVVSWESSEVDVYDSIHLRYYLSRQLKLKELIGPLDIGSCNTNKCLYIFDSKSRSGQSKEILRVYPNGKLICKWSTGTDWGYGLSVTYESNILATVSNKDMLKEYTPDGQLIREINLSTHAGIHHPFHAIKLTSGHFLVSNGDFGDDLHRVCEIDENGNLKKSFGERRGSTNVQLMHPFYLSVDGNGFVMVADQKNNRILLLDSNLEFKREILPREGSGNNLRLPTKILLDESNGRLFVLDNEPDSPKILIFDIFKCKIRSILKKDF